MDFLHSVLVQNQDPAADAVLSHDLGVNPLSVVLISIRPLNDTGTLANWPTYLSLCGALNNVSIRHNGVSIVSGSGRDLAALNYFRHGIVPTEQAVAGETNDDRRCAVLPILMGRFPYDPDSCFPASKRGELVLELDVDVAATGFNDLQYTVETIELLNAKPKEFERKVTRSRTFGTTVVEDFDLPMERLRGLLLFGTSTFGSNGSPSWGRIRVLMDNKEVGFQSTDWEVAHMLHTLMGRQPPMWDSHTHLVDATQCDAEEKTLAGPIDVGSGGWQNYAYLDYDPTRDDLFSLDANKANSMRIQADAETADAVRVIAIEKHMA